MPRVIYANGRYLPYARNAIHASDRGYQFGDGVYEVCAVYGGKIFEPQAHLERLRRSLAEIRLDLPPAFSDAVLMQIMEEIRIRNRCRDGVIYLQITRGTGARSHEFSHRNWSNPNLTVMAQLISPAAMQKKSNKGIKVKLLPDLRWGRCDIKSLNLLANSLARDEAMQGGTQEAWLVRNGVVTEGAASNAWIVSKGRLYTHPADKHILGGITRQTILRLAREAGIAVEEKAFTPKQAASADEAFASASALGAAPVLAIDGKRVGDGKAGAITKQLRCALRELISREGGS